VPLWMRWTLSIAAWAAWQSVCLFFTFVAYTNLFSEYGLYSNRFVDPVAAVLFLMFAVWIGTWLPLRESRETQKASLNSVIADRLVRRWVVGAAWLAAGTLLYQPMIASFCGGVTSCTVLLYGLGLFVWVALGVCGVLIANYYRE
jgi:hypothetical protein